jgi:hypothetical protein
MATQHPPHPVCKALLLCERTTIAEGTGAINLFGVESNFQADENLMTHASEVFVQLTGAEGQYDIVVEIWDLQERSVIARASQRGIEIDDPEMVNSVLMPIPPMQLSSDNYHDVVVLANGEEIDRRRFGVFQSTGVA